MQKLIHLVIKIFTEVLVLIPITDFIKNRDGLISLCLIFMFCFCPLIVSANESSGCERVAVMGKCENKAMPEDFKERYKEYGDCLSEQMNIARDETWFYNPEIDENEWNNALEECKYLKPDYGREFSMATDEVMFYNLRSWIASILTCDRFHIQDNTIVTAYRESAGQAGIPPKEDKSRPTEYFFEATYDCALVPNIDTTWNNKERYPSSLNIRMYYDGEQKELVKEWTVNSPVHYFDSLTNRMFKNRGISIGHEPSLMRQEVPITNLLDAFEKKPVQCRVKPEKEKVAEGQEIDIVLSNFRDALQQPSREFNRIIVHVNEGKILNGKRCSAGSDYRVFRLNRQPITVRYRAPKNGEADRDIITVYNACEILPQEKSPLRATHPHKEIAVRELHLSHNAWKGSLTLDVVRSFQCDQQEQTSELGREEVKAYDEHIQKVNLTMGLDDFDLALQPAIPVSNNLIDDASGQMYCIYNKDHFTAGRAKKTWCFSKKWVSPGSWRTRHETWTGQAVRHIKKENVTLLIVKDTKFNKADMENLQKQMQQAVQNMDMDAINKLKGQMVGMIQGDQDSDTIPVRVRVGINVNPMEKDTIMTTCEVKIYDACQKRYKKDESRANTIEATIVHPMAVELKGFYIRGKDGRDTLTATADMTEALPGETFGSGTCPDTITTIRGQLNLERKRKGGIK